ncbi:hypothetical protein C4K03_2466 [Pseudomonas synxantha]|uniref:Uncharacterized protein n=1 Tax=Pseudomonas synxantha TaxID=47883 RepID=A0A3G7U600_9PSED|nr:hypothetical protein C4K03_2466 [Pseudomonas synxantha]
MKPYRRGGSAYLHARLRHPAASISFGSLTISRCVDALIRQDLLDPLPLLFKGSVLKPVLARLSPINIPSFWSRTQASTGSPSAMYVKPMAARS